MIYISKGSYGKISTKRRNATYFHQIVQLSPNLAKCCILVLRRRTELTLFYKKPFWENDGHCEGPMRHNFKNWLKNLLFSQNINYAANSQEWYQGIIWSFLVYRICASSVLRISLKFRGITISLDIFDYSFILFCCPPAEGKSSKKYSPFFSSVHRIWTELKTRLRGIIRAYRDCFFKISFTKDLFYLILVKWYAGLSFFKATSWWQAIKITPR